MTESLFDDLIVPPAPPPKRTWPVTVVCVIFAVMTLATIAIQIAGFGPHTRMVLYILLPLSLFLFWLLSGLWRMKKWAGIIFIVLFSLATLRRQSEPEDTYASVVSGIAVVAIATQLRKMK